MKTFSKTACLLICLGTLLASAAASLAEDNHATFTVNDFTFTRPVKWEWVEPGSTMRKAQFKIPSADGKTNAEAVFFVFSGGAGTVQANVDRWMGLFQEPREKINAKVESVTIGKTKVTYAHAEGTYMSGMPGGPKTPMADYALEGAIIEGESNNIFVRLTGPKEVVKDAAADFKKMIAGGLGKN